MKLSLHEVTKKFGDAVAVSRVSLDVQQGEFLSILGASGSGKTTILNMIAGFESPASGQILLNGKDITSIAPNKRGIGMVFQNYALFPHMTVFDNIAFPLEIQKVPRQEIHRRVEDTLELVALQKFAKQYPSQLSGGQKQRVALARAIVFQPEILLMDEPLSALDKKLRDHMRMEIKHLQEILNITTIYVTHDQQEALSMSDRIALINNGRLVQLDRPAALYEMPVSLFVADFIGESNFLEGKVVEVEDSRVCVKMEHGFSMWVKNRLALHMGEEATVSVRPEKIQMFLDRKQPSDKLVNSASGQVKEATYLGETNVYKVFLQSDVNLKVRVQSSGSTDKYRKGDNVVVGWQISHGRLIN